MRQIDIKDECLDEQARRHFGLQRLAMHLALWPAVAASAIALGLTFSSQDSALVASTRSLRRRLEIVRLARLEWISKQKQLLLCAEADVETSSLPVEARQKSLQQITRLREALNAEAALLETRISYDGDPEALTWVKDVDGRVQVLNATADGRLGEVPTISHETIQAIAVLAMRRAEAEQAQSPKQILARDLGEIHTQIEETISRETSKPNQEN